MDAEQADQPERRLGTRQAQLAREMYAEVDESGKRKWTVQQIVNELGVPRTTVYGYLNTPETTTR